MCTTASFPTGPRRPSCPFELGLSVPDKSKLEWYLKRLQRMSLLEVAWRLEDQVNKWSWSRYQVAPEQVDQQLAVNVLGLPATYRLVSAVPRFTATLPPNVIPAVPAQARDGVISSASEVLRGQWDVLGVTRKDMYDPDWF